MHSPLAVNHLGFNHILVPVDFGPCSEVAVATGLDLALHFDAQLTLMHVTWGRAHTSAAGADDRRTQFRTRTAERKLTLRLRHLVGEAGVEALGDRLSCRIERGYAPSMIVSVAKQVGADMIVIGTHGDRRPDAPGPGATTEWVTHEATCAVLEVPPPGYGAPAESVSKLRANGR